MYDMWHRTDIIRPGTNLCNIMLLTDLTDNPAPTSHRFLYAQVLGAYHANVIYTGPGMRDYKAHHFDVLWVQWYEVVDPGSSRSSNHTLDSVHFPRLCEDDSFGFVDLIDILQGCHLLPAFSKGKRNIDVVVRLLLKC